jgi:hypothetical protein
MRAENVPTEAINLFMNRNGHFVVPKGSTYIEMAELRTESVNREQASSEVFALLGRYAAILVVNF